MWYIYIYIYIYWHIRTPIFTKFSYPVPVPTSMQHSQLSKIMNCRHYAHLMEDALLRIHGFGSCILQSSGRESFCISHFIHFQYIRSCIYSCMLFTLHNVVFCMYPKQRGYCRWEIFVAEVLYFVEGKIEISTLDMLCWIC